MDSNPTVIVHSALVDGRVGRAADVRASAEAGPPRLRVLSMPQRQSDETARRVVDALLSSGLPVPAGTVTIEVSPGPVDDGHPELDLPIAIAVLVACGHLIQAAVAGVAAVGELRPSGAVGRTFPLAPALDAIAARTVVVPTGHLTLPSHSGAEILRVASLRQAVETLCDRTHTVVTSAQAVALQEAPSVPTDFSGLLETLAFPIGAADAGADEPRRLLRRRVLFGPRLRRSGS